MHEAGWGVRNGPVGGVGLWRKFRHSSTKRDHNYRTIHYDCEGTNNHCGTNDNHISLYHRTSDHHGCADYHRRSRLHHHRRSRLHHHHTSHH